MRAEIVGPLLAWATADGVAVVTAQSRVWELSREQRSARGLRKRSSASHLGVASGERATIEDTTRERWGSIPVAAVRVEEWAETVANRQADTDPRIIELRQRVDETMQEQRDLTARRTQERRALDRQTFGDRTLTRPRTQAAAWRRRAATARRDLAAIEALPVAEAARLIKEYAARQQSRREAAEKRLHGRIRAQRPSIQAAADRGIGR